jgi:hypothetical protein
MTKKGTGYIMVNTENLTLFPAGTAKAMLVYRVRGANPQAPGIACADFV